MARLSSGTPSEISERQAFDFHGAQDAGHVCHIDVFVEVEVRFGKVLADVRLQHAPGGESAGEAGNDRFRDPEFLGKEHSVHGSGTAKGHEGEVAGFDAAGDGDGPDRLGHLGVGDVTDAFGHGDGVQAELVTNCLQGCDRGFPVQGDLSAGEPVGVDTAEHQVGVGDGGFGPPRP